MSKRLQVTLSEDELKEIQATAKRHRQTTAAWVRDALRAARRASEPADMDHKLEAIRRAAQHQGPTGDIREMLDQIERGYTDAGQP